MIRFTRTQSDASSAGAAAYGPAAWRRGPVAALVMVLALLAAVTASSGALADEGDTTRWSVTPADERGADDRVSIQHALDPGESVTDHIAVSNIGTQDATFSLVAADGITTRSGKFDMLAAGKESVDAGTWIDIEPSISIEAGQTAIVPFTITVPDNAEPGDHPAGVAASFRSTQSSESGASVGVDSRVGIKVITRVNGELTPSAAVENVSADYTLNWNPFRAGSATVTFDVVNTGNTRISAEGDVTIGSSTVLFPRGDEPAVQLLPGDRRTFSLTLTDIWPLFRAGGDVHVTPQAAAYDGSAPEVAPVEESFSTWALPWPQLIVLIGIALVLISIFWNSRRSRRRLKTMLDAAREEGRKAAAATIAGESETAAAVSSGAPHRYLTGSTS